MPHPDDYDDHGDDRYDDRRRDDEYDRRGDDRHDDRDRAYDDYDDRPRSGGGLRRAAEKVTLPAIFLMVVGFLGFGMSIFRTVVLLTVGIPNPHPFVNQNAPNAAQMQQLVETAETVGPIFNFIWSLIVFFGGLQMKRLHSRGFVLFSCIWAMLPCNTCCLLGIPFGIWAIIVINNDLVKRAFEQTARGGPHG